jgi:hypothetical protein
MPLVIGFAFLIGIVVPVVLGSHLLGPDSWPLQSDQEKARRAKANADRLRQQLRGAVSEDRVGVAARHVETAIEKALAVRPLE